MCRSLDRVNVALVFICRIWADDVEETPFGRLFRCEAWLVPVHADAPFSEVLVFPRKVVSVYFLCSADTNRRKVLRAVTPDRLAHRTCEVLPQVSSSTLAEEKKIRWLLGVIAAMERDLSQET